MNHVAVVGNTLFGASPHNGELAAWDVETGASKPVPITDNRKIGYLVASRDGSTLAVMLQRWGTRMRHDLVVYDGLTSSPIRSFKGDMVGTTALGVSPDSKTLLVSSVLGHIYDWDLARGEMRRLTRSSETQSSEDLGFLPDGKHVIHSVGSYYVRIREARTGRVVRQWDARHRQLALARLLPDGERLVTSGADGAVRLWWLGKSQPAAAPRPPTRFTPVQAPQVKEVGKVAFEVARGALSSDGKLLVLDGKDGQVALMDLDSGAVRWQVDAKTRSQGSHIYQRWLAFGAGDKTLIVSGNGLEKRGPIKPLMLVLDAVSGKVRRTLRPRTAGPMVLHGDKVLIGGRHPALLSADTLAVAKGIEVSSEKVLSVAVSPNRKRLFLGDDSGATTVADAESGKPLVLLMATQDGEYVAATPDGAYLASLEGARRLAWVFHQPLEGFAFEQFAAKFERPELVRRLLSGQSADDVEPPSRPPSIALKGERPARQLGEQAVRLKASVAAAGRVDRVRAYVNGRPAVDELVCKPAADVDIEIPLQRGRNRVHLMAYDGSGYASNPVVLDVTSTSKQAKRPTLWVLTVGVSRYPKLAPEHQLDVADDDARAIASAFSAYAGPGQPFETVNAVTLIDEQVTVGSVEHALLSLTKMAPEDVAVVFFAGHGVKLDDGGMVFLTHGATLSKDGAKKHGVGWQRVDRVLSHVKGRVLLLLDACHSGHVSTELIAQNDALAGQLAAGDRTGVLVFAAARGAQLSYEVGGGGSASRGLELAWEGAAPKLSEPIDGGHGLFTAAVLEAVSGRAPDRDRSGAIEIGEFIDYVTERVRVASNGQQTPWVARREMFGDFVVAPIAR